MRWNITTLDDICFISKGKKHAEVELSQGTYRYIQIDDLHGGGLQKFTSDIGTAVKHTDVLIAWDGANAGKVGVGFDGMIGSTLARLRPKIDGVEPRYLFWFLESKFDLIKSQRTGATIPHVNGTMLRSLRVPLPPLPVQKQIADTLDKADALRKKDQQLMQKHDELAQSIFYEMFGDPMRNERGWKQESLSSVCDQITDGTHFSPPNVETGVPYVTAKHLKKYGLDFFSDPTYVSEQEHRVIYSRCKPVKGDVLYIKDGATTGIAAINEYDFEFSMLSSLALIKPRLSSLNNYYLKYWLNDESVKEMYTREFMAGAAIKRFTLQKINQFRINLPPVQLQNEFAERIKKVEKLRQVKVLSTTKSSYLFERLLNTNFS